MSQELLTVCKLILVLTDLVEFLNLGFKSSQQLLRLIEKLYLSQSLQHPLAMLCKCKKNKGNFKQENEENTKC